jgi:hypothetical protein
MLFDELLLVQYLVSRSHKAGGLTFEGRYTLPELFARLRNSGYLRSVGVPAQNPAENEPESPRDPGEETYDAHSIKVLRGRFRPVTNHTVDMLACALAQSSVECTHNRPAKTSARTRTQLRPDRPMG